MDEMVDALRLLSERSRAAFAGEFYRFGDRDAPESPCSAQCRYPGAAPPGHPPRRAGRGRLIVSAPRPADAKASACYARASRRRDVRHCAVQSCVQLWVSVGETEADVRSFWRARSTSRRCAPAARSLGGRLMRAPSSRQTARFARSNQRADRGVRRRRCGPSRSHPAGTGHGRTRPQRHGFWRAVLPRSALLTLSGVVGGYRLRQLLRERCHSVVEVRPHALIDIFELNGTVVRARPNDDLAPKTLPGDLGRAPFEDAPCMPRHPAATCSACWTTAPIPICAVESGVSFQHPGQVSPSTRIRKSPSARGSRPSARAPAVLDGAVGRLTPLLPPRRSRGISPRSTRSGTTSGSTARGRSASARRPTRRCRSAIPRSGGARSRSRLMS